MNKLKKLLDKQKITNAEFAKHCNISARTVSRYRNVENDAIPVKYMKLAKGLVMELYLAR